MTLNNWMDNLSNGDKDVIFMDMKRRLFNLKEYNKSFNNPFERMAYHGDNRKMPVSIKQKLNIISLDYSNPSPIGLTAHEMEYLDLSFYYNKTILDEWGIINLYRRGKLTVWVKDKILPGKSLPYFIYINLDDTYVNELTGWINITDELTYKLIWIMGKRFKKDCKTLHDCLSYLPNSCNNLYKTFSNKYRIY